jgi:hypothetical protein
VAVAVAVRKRINVWETKTKLPLLRTTGILQNHASAAFTTRATSCEKCLMTESGGVRTRTQALQCTPLATGTVDAPVPSYLPKLPIHLR